MESTCFKIIYIPICVWHTGGFHNRFLQMTFCYSKDRTYHKSKRIVRNIIDETCLTSYIEEMNARGYLESALHHDLLYIVSYMAGYLQ